MTATTALARGLARLSPAEVDPGEDLARSLAFLGWDLRPETVVRAGHGTAAVIAVLALPLAWLAPAPFRPAALGGALALALGAGRTVVWLPGALATARRTAALGDAPGIVGRAVLRMRIEPTVESAAAFAALAREGPLARSLAAHVRAAAGTPRSGLARFADEWRPWFPALDRATGLIVAAADAPPGERARTLDRAVTAVLDCTRDRMADFAEQVRGPATALYAFGVLLPLALVAVLPAARVAGFAASFGLLVVVYDLLLPAVTLGASGWLLARRPVAFPPPSVDRSHPEVPDGRWQSVLAGLAAGVGAWFAAGRFVAGWTAPLAAVGCGLGTALVVRYRPITRVREQVRAVEEGLPDALYLVGRRVTEGEAVETAIEGAATEVPGATGEVLVRAAAVGRRLRVGIGEAFLGETGVLAEVPSPRARSGAALLATAAREGEPAGRAAVVMADHLSELRSVEREARRELATVTGTLRHTAAVFGPLVAGATVALADGMAVHSLSLEGDAPTAPPIPTADLGLAVGAYVLFLAAVLTALAVGLERGLDRALVGHRVGWALLSATGVFLAAVRMGGLLI